MSSERVAVEVIAAHSPKVLADKPAGHEGLGTNKDPDCVGDVSWNCENAVWPQLHNDKYKFREIP